MAHDLFEFVLIRVVVPAAVLGAIGGLFYLVERCSADEPAAESPSSPAARASNDAGTKPGDGGLTPEQREKIRRAIARLDGAIRLDPIVPEIPHRKSDGTSGP